MNDHSVKIRVEKAGLLTLVQDLGRIGHQSFGLSLGGALDRRAMRMANWLVGQSEDAPVLEITLQGPVIRFDGNLQVAITGADLNPQIDGKAVARYQTLEVQQGQTLQLGMAQAGCRAYVAIRGKWQLSNWLGSYSGIQIAGKYWPEGSRLEAGSEISVTPGLPIDLRKVETKKIPHYSHQLTVRVLPGPEFGWFSEAAIRYFTTRAFTIGPNSNRMGYRLRESIPDFQLEQELISSGIVPGTVQVLPSGSPVVLLADAQTSGGYPRMANVVQADLDYLAQLVPGDRIRFVFL